MTSSQFPLRKLKYVTRKIGSGKTPLGGGESYRDEGIVFLRSQNIHFDGIRVDDVVFIDERTHREMASTRVRSGDVLLNITGASLGRVSKVSVGFPEANVNQHVCIVRPDSRSDSRFLAAAISSSLVQQQIFAQQVGGNRDGLNFEQVGNLEVPTCSLEEQRRIAAFLDAETGRINRLIELRESQKKLFGERIASCISEEYRTDGSVDLVRLGYLATVQSGVTVDASRSVTGDVVTRPYLRVANVQAGRVKLDNVSEITVLRKTAASSTLRAGDVLMTEGGDLDKLGRGTVWYEEIPRCLHQNHVFAVRPETRLDPEYLALLTQSAYARKYFESTGTKTTNLASTSSGKIRDFRVPLISLSSQREVVRCLNLEISRAESILALLDQQAALLSERRQALITAAVTGELDVTTARRG